jgi:putative NADH-flavin reductase
MRITLFGATVTIGSRILDEALTRGHEVTDVVRDPARMKRSETGLRVRAGDAVDAQSVAAAAKGQDVVVSAIGPTRGASPRILVDAAGALLDGVRQAAGPRLVVVGGAGSLEVAPGVQLVDTPDFPAAWKAVALAHRDALAVYRAADPAVDWVYVSPAGLIRPGERTGRYRVGGDRLLTDASGASRISAEDFVVALLEEIEHPTHHRKRITVAY